MTFLLQRMIAVYRAVLSPVLAGLGCGCRFYPSCSVYAQDALRLLPWPRAVMLIVWRVLRCHPWHPGGLDPVRQAGRM